MLFSRWFKNQSQNNNTTTSSYEDSETTSEDENSQSGYFSSTGAYGNSVVINNWNQQATAPKDKNGQVTRRHLIQQIVK